jgi:uncharacterized protein (DUF1330 family)
MPVYYMNSYDITNTDEYQKYGPLAIPLIIKYGGEVLAADTDGIAIEGNAKQMNAIIRFPSEDAALSCYNDPEYQEVKKIRVNSTANCSMVLVKHFTNG